MTPFEKNILAVYGKVGEEWLNSLPLRLKSLSQHWGLTDLKPISNLSFNYVAVGKRDHLPVVLKIEMDKKSLAHEAAALKIFQCYGGIRLLDEELSQGALLLEQAIPGVSLKSFFPNKEEESIEIAATIIRQLHQVSLPQASSFPTLEGWLPVLDREWEIPNNYLLKARSLKEKLFKLSSSRVLLHGDLHHGNILRHGNRWVAIDPKGIIGDPIFDITTFLYNPLPDFLNSSDPKDLLSQRIHLFANALKIEETPIKEWAFVKAVLSLCWALEDNLEVKPYLSYLEILD